VDNRDAHLRWPRRPAGASVILGTDFALTPQNLRTYGIDAITVALLGRAKPGGVVLAALLYGSLNAGGVTMQAQTQIPSTSRRSSRH